MIPLLEQLFQEIKHGDQEHQDWLRNKMEKFSRKHQDILDSGHIDAMKFGMRVMAGKHSLPKPSRAEMRSCAEKVLVLIEGSTMMRTRKKHTKKKRKVKVDNPLNVRS